jgi:hypothetical protein
MDSMNPEKENIQNPETDQSDSERIQFKITIMKDGTTIIGDVPSELISILKKIYPDDSRLIDSETKLEEPEEPPS